MNKFNNLNKIIPSIELIDINKRAKLDTGKECNYACSFCYYRNQLDEKDSLCDIKKRIDYIVESGIKEIDLSGGESSIHDNFFEILDYCNSKNLSISMLSNGTKFDDIKFLQKAHQNGLKEILFSLHGFEDEHNKIVHCDSAYNKLIQSINNCHKLGIKVRINTTITQLFKNKESMIHVYKMLKPHQINFLTLNEFNDAKTFFPYSKSIPIIKYLIDNLKNDINEINVRYTPFCLMKGYEQYICNTLQHIYDKDDWNIVAYDYKVNPTDVLVNVKEYEKVVKDRRTKFYNKDKECISCSHFLICDGVEKNAKNYNLEPYQGEKIQNINFYRD